MWGYDRVSPGALAWFWVIVWWAVVAVAVWFGSGWWGPVWIHNHPAEVARQLRHR
jgi:hypothetical protein